MDRLSTPVEYFKHEGPDCCISDCFCQLGSDYKYFISSTNYSLSVSFSCIICIFIDQAPIFSLVEERSSGGVPSIDVTFSDGYKDTIVLSRFYANEEERADRVEACHYTGKLTFFEKVQTYQTHIDINLLYFLGYLANEVNACVAMTGCVGSEDLDFTILSDHVNGPTLFKWTKEGNVEVLHSSDPSKVVNLSFLLLK